MKKFFTALLIALLFTGSSFSLRAQESKNLKGKKIALIIAAGQFRDEEYAKPKQYFEDKEATVITVSTTTEKVSGSLGMSVKPQILLKDLKTKDYDAIVFVGGSGAKEYYDNQDAMRVIKEAYDQKKVIAAICIAPNILCKAGILKGKKATAWAFEVSGCDAIKTGKSVERDGNIVTANGPEAALDFAKMIEKVIMSVE